ncbi:Putative membrane protein YdgH [Pirellulimonas nuda]|uniref:Membrane protein YdgH n=1 Tax=Pirellulimonas nuda TaxID=2528009 RepID=A0A518D618_9BACT|nr:MMPL family transporter [Pirellulimonas nuda]QDU86918.1 Putative membrane protein YdgH [Pirellulimonas nuda]
MLKFAAWFASHRGVVGVFIGIVTLLAAIGYVRPAHVVHPLEKYETRLREADPAVADQVSRRLDLSRSDSFLVVDAPDLFTPRRMAAVRRMVDAVEALPIVDSVFWADRVPMLNVFGFADPLIPAEGAGPEALAEARQKLLVHPLAQQLVSDDGNALLMPVTYDWLELAAEGSAQTVDQVLATARGALAEGASADSPIRVRLTGRTPLFAAQKSAFDRNKTFFQMVGYLLALVLAILMFRGVAAVAVISLAPALGVFWSLGLVKLLGVPSNPLAEVVMPVMVSMIGLTDGVHLLVQIRRERLAGAAPIDASRLALEKVGMACWLTSLTTAVGFASLLLAGSDYVRDFGLICCCGVVIAFMAIITFVPLLCSTWVGRYVERGESRDLVSHSVDWLGRLIDWIIARKWVVSAGSVAATLALAAVALRLGPDNRLASAMPAGAEAYQALAYCDEHFGGIEFFRVVMRWPEGVDEDDPQVLAAIRDTERVIKAEPLLAHPLSVRGMLASMPGDPEDLETQVTFLSLLPSELRGFFYRPAEREAVVSVRMQDKGIAKYTPVFDRLEQTFVDGLAAAHPGYAWRLEGTPVKLSRDLYQIVDDLRRSLATASVVILIVLGIAYRSARAGLISVVPNLFPLAATGTLLVFTNGSLDMSAVCAFVVCLGIAVDDTIHFLSRFRQEVAVDGDVDAAIRRAFVAVGSALIMTTVILVTGFGAMLMSDLPGHRTFAAMACCTISTALVGDLVALPALLSCFYRGAVRPHPEPADR